MSDFTTITDTAPPEEGELTAVFVGPRRIAIANAGGAFYAFEDTCTHMGCSLSDGELEETTVTCPCHMGEYDIRTGEVLGGPPPKAVATFPVEVVDGAIRIQA